MVRPPRALSVALATLVLAAGLLPGCLQVLGIEEAELDPGLDEDLGGAAQLTGGDDSEGGVCEHFDNASRLGNLLPDGSLRPLPPAE